MLISRRELAHSVLEVYKVTARINKIHALVMKRSKDAVENFYYKTYRVDTTGKD